MGSFLGEKYLLPHSSPGGRRGGGDAEDCCTHNVVHLSHDDMFLWVDVSKYLGSGFSTRPQFHLEIYALLCIIVERGYPHRLSQVAHHVSSDLGT